MKTMIITLTIIFTASMAMARAQATYLPSYDNALALHDEAYVNDIPFDTWKVSRVAQPGNLSMPALPEEAYVDDIPFDTRKIAAKALLCGMLQRSEEPPVNDIPFDTRKVCQTALLQECISEYREEAYVDDIPFESLESWEYNAHKDILIISSGARMEIRGIRSLNHVDFRTDLEQYMEQFREKVQELDHLTFDEPF